MSARSPQTARLVVGSFPIDRRSDADLVRLVAEGNDAALAVIFHRYGLVVRRTLLAQLHSDAAVDDLTQEVFLGFHRTAAHVADPDKLRAYLVGTAFRQAKQHIRQKTRRRRLLGFFGDAQRDETYATPTAHARDDLRCLKDMLARLPERLRDSFVLRYVEELGPQEVADARGVSLATAKRDIARARERVLYYAEREPALCGYLRAEASLAEEPSAHRERLPSLRQSSGRGSEPPPLSAPTSHSEPLPHSGENS